METVARYMESGGV